jgi:hypothetical protein
MHSSDGELFLTSLRNSKLPAGQRVLTLGGSWSRGGSKGMQLSRMSIYEFTLTWIPLAVRRSYVVSSCDRIPSEAELAAHRGFMMCDRLRNANLDVLMSYIEPRATLRPEFGGAGEGSVTDALNQMLGIANAGLGSPNELRSMFDLLAPYTSGNGRCGRALWMWRALRGSEDDVAEVVDAGVPFMSDHLVWKSFGTG